VGATELGSRQKSAISLSFFHPVFHAAATGRPMTSISQSSYLNAVRALAPHIVECAEESERARRLSPPLANALAEAGLFRLWIPRAFGGEEVDASRSSRSSRRHRGSMEPPAGA
jgi:hypothetical protein